ncbi:MAG: TerD family protein [Lachnospiraceae bacterium]|nr:TerD family protein [Robinsoniella sp.]MDY3767045.1 TerD family protein [Lachnospiraceae bacterium]
MTVNLKKGQKISLTKESAGLDKVVVGLGWDAVDKKDKGGFLSMFKAKPSDIDCDASAILLKNGKLVRNEDIVYFGRLKHDSGSVQHMGDNLTGDGDGDDEQIFVELSRVPADYDRIVIVVNIYQAQQRHQDFGMIKNAFIRVVDGKTNRELCKYNLSENYDGMTAMIFGEVYRRDKEWKFNAIGQATQDSSLSELAKRYL